MDYPKSVPNVGLVNGKFVDENTTTGQVGSLIPAKWGNAVTDELLNVLEAASIVPDESDNKQIASAISKIASESSVTKEELNNGLASKVTGDNASQVGFNNGDLQKPYIQRKSDGLNCSLQPALSYTPVQQGTGIGQEKNTIKIGWSGAGLKATVDLTDLGVIWSSYNFDPNNYILKTQLPTATEDSKGCAYVATTGQVNQGADDSTIVTPKKLLFGFRAQLANNGYIIFPSWLGGFVIQWASGVNAAVSGGGITSQDVQFPIPFPNAVLGGLVTSKYISGTTTVSYESASGLNNSKVGVTVVNPVSSGSGVSQPRVYFFGY
ncbi:gp53-like domain-containing protein [Pseudomonas protegens]|uniref:gp53-like domain-containing protein n=1 Tax=Pseudomonas protegens TaxID=380021 RepID=UPI0022404B10|nr:hypothetical protein [Pseudomonas protegens]